MEFSSEMEAFHSFWSAPNAIRNNGVISFPDYEMLTMILSALKWREHSGPISMITDTPGAEFFCRAGLSSLWDELDTSLDRMDYDVDPLFFWAAGKLYALLTRTTPCVMLDTDLIVWKHPPIPEDVDVCAAHAEALNPAVYPDLGSFRFSSDYTYPADWDFSLPACNTAFLYLRNREFRDYYVSQAIRIFQSIRTEGLNPVTAMCFAEQRILTMCSKAENQKLAFLLHPAEFESQNLMTHTWGLKNILRTSPKANYQFCMRCVKRILTDYPEGRELLSRVPALKPYLKEAE